jgi:hypothetical protein
MIVSSQYQNHPMNFLLKALGGLFSISSTLEQDRDAAYLAESTDIYDLERRMRQIDSVGHSLYSSGPYGICLR